MIGMAHKLDEEPEDERHKGGDRMLSERTLPK